MSVKFDHVTKHYLHSTTTMSETRNVVCNLCCMDVDRMLICTAQQKVPSRTVPYADLPSVNNALFEAKARSGETRID
jgi:hypothetical protein